MIRRIFCSLLFCIITGGTLLTAQSDAASLPRLGVLIFDVSDPLNQTLVDDALIISNLILSNIEQTQRFNVVSRQDLERLAAEQPLQAGAITEPQNLSRFKMLNIDYIVEGRVNAVRRDYVITMGVLDIAGGQYTYSDYIIVSNAADMILEGADRLSSRLMENFGQPEGSADPRPLGPPANIQAENTGIDSISLSWDTMGEGVSYRVYHSRRNNPAAAIIYGGEWQTGENVKIENLMYNSVYYFWVASIENGIESAKSAVISKELPATMIGQKGPAGGIIFYDKGDSSGDWQYLEAAPRDVGKAEWGAFNIDISGTDTGVGTGKRNTELIVAMLDQLGETGKAAQLCDTYVYGDHSDWFLPSMEELILLYQNIAHKRLGNFKVQEFYWSSSQISDYAASYKRLLYDGWEAYNRKTFVFSVRPIRAF
jgi:hypothetical protein